MSATDNKRTEVADESALSEQDVKSEAERSAPVSDAPVSGAPVTESEADSDMTKSKTDRAVPFAESDWHETQMTYDHGKVPLYVAAVWLVSLVGLVIYFVRYGMPDLQSWGMP